MRLSFPTLTDLLNHGYDDVIDVRSPAEFAEDHVPGAINLPALNDQERIAVGTLYKQDAYRARVLGAGMVTSNISNYLRGPLADKDGGWRPLVYCWRGGQRSGVFGTIMAEIGWRVGVIEGGYRTYRRHVVSQLHDAVLPFKLILLDGYTGTAKTEMLGLVHQRGHQILDLEGLANHRGSVFGQQPAGQPSQKGFETRLAIALANLEPNMPVMVEAESSKIGNVILPPSLWAAMKNAPRITVEAPLAERASYLVRAYSDILADVERVKFVLGSLVSIQGRERIDIWCKLIEEGKRYELILQLMQYHYDPRYGRGQKRRKPGIDAIRISKFTDDELNRAADKLIQVATSI